MSGDNTDQTQSQGSTEPKPGSPEYNEAMIQKAREARGETTDPGTNPGSEPGRTGTNPGSEPGRTGNEDGQETVPDVPDKFKNEDGSINVEALAKSYRELETKASTQETQQQQEAAQQTDEDSRSVAEKAGLDFDQLKQKVAETGEIDDADYAAFEKIGVPKNLVQEVIQFRQQQAEAMRSQAIEYIGGEKETNELLEWAGENLTEAEIDTYNSMLGSQDWKAAVDRLKALRGLSSRTADEPKRLTQPGESASTSDGFATRDELREAMADPRYFQKNAEGQQYRNEVMRKVQNSPKEVRKATN